jgi:hypothetical protein
MNRTLLMMAASGALMCFICTDILAQRGRGGGGRGGGGGGGASRGGGGFSAPARPAPAARPSPAPSRPAPSAAPRPAGGGGIGGAPAPRATGTGPGGGNFQTGKGGGSYTTQGGSTINYKGAAAGGTTGGGISGGKYVGGVQVTTPGGQTINRVGSGGAAAGPGGNAAAGRSNITGTTGPAGSGAAASRSGAVSGPGGAAAGRAAVATGPGGTAAARTGAATGPYGSAAYRAGATNGTYYRSAAAVSNQYNSVVRNFANQYPGLAVRWAGFTYRPITWAALAGYCGYSAAESTSYDYGSSVVYQDDAVYVNGEQVATTAEYADQAAAIAEEGKKAEPAKDEEFKSLGVFAMVQGEETSSNNIFQLSISKNGVIRGEYYNALTDTTEQVFGSVDKKTQRVAWTVGDKKVPTYEAGVVNLTEDQATMMVHYSKERSQQMTLFRIEKPEGDPAAGQPTPAPKP